MGKIGVSDVLYYLIHFQELRSIIQWYVFSGLQTASLIPAQEDMAQPGARAESRKRVGVFANMFPFP